MRKPGILTTVLLAFVASLFLAGCDDDDDENGNNNSGTQFAPLTAASLTDPNAVYTVNVAGQAPFTLRFPNAGQYQIIVNGQPLNGTISNLQRNGNTWTATLTPDPNQQGAQGGPVTLTWTGTNAGTFTLLPQGGAAQNGTFTATQANPVPNSNPGQTNNPNPGQTNSPPPVVTGLTGKTLQLSYQPSGGEKFVFTSATTASFEDGSDTATYTYSTASGQLNITRSGGQTYQLIISSGASSGTTTVTYQEPGGNPSSNSSTFTLQ